MWRRVAFKNQMSTGYMLKYFAHFFIMLRQNVADKIAHYEFLHTHRQWLITHGAFIGAERVNVISRWFNLSGSSLLVFSCTMESHFWHEVVVSSIARPDNVLPSAADKSVLWYPANVFIHSLTKTLVMCSVYIRTMWKFSATFVFTSLNSLL